MEGAFSAMIPEPVEKILHKVLWKTVFSFWETDAYPENLHRLYIVNRHEPDIFTLRSLRTLQLIL